MLKYKKVKNFGKGVEDTHSLCSVFSVLGDKNRFKIMKYLVKKKEMCVGELAKVLNVSVSAVSQHLRILEMSGLVSCRKDGQMMCYSPRIYNQQVQKIISLMYALSTK